MPYFKPHISMLGLLNPYVKIIFGDKYPMQAVKYERIY